MLEPKEIIIHNMNGEPKTFVISKMPYFAARQVITQFIPTGTPKIGSYKDNEELAALIMKHVAVVTPEGTKLLLETRAMVENHVDLKQGLLIEKEMLEYNGGFLGGENLAIFLNALVVKAQELISKTLTPLREQSSAKAKQRSKNSKKATR